MVYTPKEAADALGVSTATILRRIKDGSLTACKLSARQSAYKRLILKRSKKGVRLVILGQSAEQKVFDEVVSA